MVDIISLLPLLNGWKYVTADLTATVPVGNSVELYSDPISQAWLLDAALLATDAYTTITMTFKPTDFLFQATIATTYQTSALASLPGPDFSVSLYNQPSPSFTVGTYLLNFSCSYPLPLPPNTKFRITLSLSAGTTSQNSVCQGNLVYVKVIDEDLFRQSLKEIGVS